MPEEIITTGIELECAEYTNGAYARAAELGIRNHEDNTIVSDVGKEVEWVTPALRMRFDVAHNAEPIMTNADHIYEWVADLCSLAARVNSSCGVHAHYGNPGESGKSMWSPEQVRVWLAIGYALEDRLWGLCPDCRRNTRFALPLGAVYGPFDGFLDHPAGLVKRNKRENPKRYAWMNVIETKRIGIAGPCADSAEGEATGTVEIRMLGNTRRASYINAWTVFWGKVAAYVAYYPPTSVLMAVAAGCLEKDLEQVKKAKLAGARDVATPRVSVPLRASRDPVARALRQLSGE